MQFLAFCDVVSLLRHIRWGAQRWESTPSKRFVRPDTEDYLANKEPEVFKKAKEVLGDLIK